MIQKFFLTFVFLTSIFATSLHASDALGTGFLIGAYGAFDIFHFHSEEKAEGGGMQLIEQFESTHRAPGGGGCSGYGFCFCDRFVNAFKAGVTGYGSSAEHANPFSASNSPSHFF